VLVHLVKAKDVLEVLSLCDTGKVKGLKSGVYTSVKQNKGYAIEALELLADNPSLSNEPGILWNRIQGGNTKNIILR